jgi:hypothetical protein
MNLDGISIIPKNFNHLKPIFIFYYDQEEISSYLYAAIASRNFEDSRLKR